MKKLVATYSVIGIAIACIWFFTAYVPYHREKQMADGRIADANSQLADFQATIAELPRIMSERESLLSRKRDLDSKLYTKEDVLQLFDSLEEDALRWNLKITEITPPIEELLYLNSIVADSSLPQFLNIGVCIEGDYVAFGRFIAGVESADYFRGINRCKILSRSDTDTKITLHVDFKALLGSLKDEA